MASNELPQPRGDVLGLLRGQRPRRLPCFSGLINITASGLDSLGLHLSDVHADAGKLAAAAETTHGLFGFESAVVPLDLCVEAEALGATVDFQAGTPRPEFPIIAEPLATSLDGLNLRIPPDLLQRGRLPVVAEALRLLAARRGAEIVVGALLPGPFTLAMYVTEMSTMLTGVVEAPQAVQRILDTLAEVLIEVGSAYRAAGADFVTVHEMGGSPGYVGPGTFKKLVLPPLQRLLAGLPRPHVLSVCGNTNRALPLLADAGADALSVDQLNDLARTRAALGPDAILFGNIDPVGTLAHGTPADVRQAVAGAAEAGVDAIWPGCDLFSAAPPENLRALVQAARESPRP